MLPGKWQRVYLDIFFVIGSKLLCELNYRNCLYSRGYIKKVQMIKVSSKNNGKIVFFLKNILEISRKKKGFFLLQTSGSSKRIFQFG